MAASAPDLPRLTILAGPLAGKELVLEEVVDNILIGADASCRFHLPLPGISPIHARIWMDAAGVTVYDTHSPRGLYVNDDRVSGQVPLRNGDILWLGTPGEEEAVMIQCRFPPRAVAAMPPPPAPAAPDESETESTVVMSAPSLSPAPAPVESDALEVVEEPVAPELEAVEESADATMVIGPADDFAVAAPEDSEADSTVVMAAPAAATPVEEPESDATLVGGVDSFYVQDQIQDQESTQAMPAVEDDPVRFAVEMPAPPEEAAPNAPTFEDETQISDAPFALAALPPVTPLLPDEGEEEPAPPPRYEPPPPVMAPPPTPIPAPRPAPPPSPEPGPRPARAGAPAAKAAAPEAARPRPATSGGGGRYVALGAVGLLVLAGGGFLAWRLVQSKSAPLEPPPTTLVSVVEAPATTLGAAPPPQPTTPPETTPAEPVVEEMVTIVRSPPPSAAPGVSPSPGVKPTPPPKTASVATPPPVSPEVAHAQQTAAQVASLLGQAQSAGAAHNFESAAQLYEDVLKLEPQNPQAVEGRGTAQAAVLSLKKAFVASKTTVRSGKAAKGPAGFDSEDVSVATPDYSGRIEFEASPKNVKPGDNYTVSVYLLNNGKKSFKLGGASVTTAVNGAKSGGSIQTNIKDIEPGQRLPLTELPGVWQGGTAGWSVEVVVSTSRDDTFRSVLTWR